MTDYEYRRIPEERYDQLREHIQYAYWPESGPTPGERVGSDIEARYGEPFGLVDGTDVLCFLHRHHLRARIRGGRRDLAGLSTLVTPPEHRGAGYTEPLHREQFQRARGRGVAFAAAWPFKHAFYHRYGWATGNKLVRWECSPSTLRPAGRDGSGSFRRLEPDDWELIDPVYRAYSESFALALERTEAWWKNQVFQPATEPFHAYAWERDRDIRGYVVFDVSQNDGRTLQVVDLAYADHEAYRHLLGFLANHHSKIERISMTGPVETTLLDAVEAPNAVECSVHPGVMVRLVDVPGALETVSYPAGVDGTVTLRVTDPICEWNDGTFALSVTNGAATCEPTAGDPDVNVDVAALSQLVVGYRDLDELVRTGDLTVHDEACAATLSKAFPSETVFLRDRF